MPKYLKVLLVLLSLLGYFALAFLVARHDDTMLLSIYFALFLLYLIKLRSLNHFRTNEILLIAIVLRMVVFIALPNLSDDFYRFIWDGRVLSAGNNPFQFLPEEYLNTAPNLDAALFYKLNSPNYYTIYPPFVQFIFLISTSIFPNELYGSVLIMKFFAFIAEIGLIVMMIRILRRMGMPTRYVAIYAFNPLVIVEITGNLHHEGITLFFLIFAIYFLYRGKYISSAAMWALSVATKLIPLIFLPLLIRRLKYRDLLVFSLIFLFVLIILFLPLFEGLPDGMKSSLSLYFQKFEFNGSIYYLIREVGYYVKGYNIIQTAGPYLGMIVFFLVMLYSLSFREESNIFKSMTWINLIFLLFATIVHPWYIVGLIAFSVFTGYLFPVVWSFMIFLTYSGYTPLGFQENLFVVLLEYFVVAAVVIYELVKRNEEPLLYKTIQFDHSAYSF